MNLFKMSVSQQNNALAEGTHVPRTRRTESDAHSAEEDDLQNSEAIVMELTSSNDLPAPFVILTKRRSVENICAASVFRRFSLFFSFELNRRLNSAELLSSS